MDTKVLSIGIAAYNMDKYLNRCVDSLLIRNIDKLEIIIVNNASTDDTSAIAHSYAEKYPGSVKVVDIEVNHHYGGAVNAAIGCATGKYFKLCDADDKYDTASLEKFIPFLAAAQSDIVFSPYKILDFESKETSSLEPVEKYSGRTMDIEDVDWQSPELVRYRAMHAMCTRTDILRENHYIQTEGVSYTDTEFIFYSVLYSRTCSFFARPIYLYYLGRDGQTMSPASMVKSNMHFYTTAKRMLDDYVKLPKDLGREKQELLYRTVRACVFPFVAVSLLRIKDNKKQLALIAELLKESDTSILACPFEEDLMKERYYRMWKKYHIPSRLLQALMTIRRR